ncbi:hypothetical protein GX645_00550 [Candidatus Sumerlaeota bacterium]|nr:hypothetical protein [Candidatus Sumerlaeota bacterium]
MPEVNEVHIDAALTGVSVAYTNTDYAADVIAPAVPVLKQSDRYFICDPDREWMRKSDDLRSPGTPANEVGYYMSSDSYYCQDHALEASVPDEERDNADPAIAPDIDRTEFLTEKIMLNREVALSNMLNDADIPSVSLSEDDAWTTPTSNPIDQFRTAQLSIASAIQRRANVLLVGQEAFDALANHPAIIERIKYTSASAITEDVLARLFQIERVVVGRAWTNISALGRQPIMQPVWGDNAFLIYVTPRPGLRNIGALSTFTWNAAHTAANTNGYIVDRWREPERKADVIRVQKYYDHKLVTPKAAYRFENVILH